MASNVFFITNFHGQLYWPMRWGLVKLSRLVLYCSICRNHFYCFLFSYFFSPNIILEWPYVQAITYLTLLKHLENDPGPHLIVCPASVLENWERELKRWCPTFRVLLYHGSARSTYSKELSSLGKAGMPPPFDVILVCYSLFERHRFVSSTIWLFSIEILCSLIFSFTLQPEGHISVCSRKMTARFSDTGDGVAL